MIYLTKNINNELPLVRLWRIKRRTQQVIFATLFVLLTFGCAGNETTKKAQPFEKWKDMAEKSRPYSPPEKARLHDLQDETKKIGPQAETKPAPERPLPKDKVTLKMHNADVPVLLRALARAGNQNIMINSNVKGKINVNVTDSSWDQVFQAILRTQGLTYSWEGNIIRIKSVEDMEHELKIDSIEDERKRVEPLQTEVFYLDYHTDLNKLKETLQASLTKGKENKPRGSVMVDEHSNSLIIQAIRSDILKMIPLLIQKLDKPTPQILIEANIVETSKGTARALGIEWGGLYKGKGGKNYWITPGADISGTTVDDAVNPDAGTAANFPIDVSGGGLTIGYLSQTIGKYILDVQLTALQEEGKLNILSSPSITTIDNQKAIVKSGKEIPYQTIDQDGNIKIEWKEATLKLEVTPHVIGDDLLNLHIITNKDEVDFT
ncbi:secretin and TonB N-terminal domain-containing protein, partial [bacterium]|nr:secretin and TonB N-terminal domain-containing protein [bacterium]